MKIPQTVTTGTIICHKVIKFFGVSAHSTSSVKDLWLEQNIN